MKYRHLIVLVAITMISLAPITQTHANMAPPAPPSGGALDASESSTYVQMVSEDVMITVGDNGADVRATYTMLNKGADEETLDVRFPVGYTWGSMTEVYRIWGLDKDSLAIKVDDKPTSFTVSEDDASPFVWITWRVTFPPGQTSRVELSYLAYAEDDIYTSFPIYSYILETGAGWYGTIGEGKVTIRLPYEINQYNVLQTDFPLQPDFYTIAGNEIIWQFTNLEPTDKDNIYAVVMPPPAWREWQEVEKEVEQNPDSVSAHLRLAHALNGAVSYRGGGYSGNGELFDRALLEYDLWLNVIPDEYVLEVIPNIIDYHLEFREMLTYTIGPVWTSHCQELRRAWAIAPDDKRVLELKNSLETCFTETTPEPTFTPYSPPGCNPQAGRCPPPTATPTIAPRPTSTPGPTRTPTVPPTLTATPTPNPQPPTPSLTVATLVGIAAVVIAGAGIGMWAARRKGDGA